MPQPVMLKKVKLNSFMNTYKIFYLVALWTVACQAPLSMGIPRQKYWRGLPFPPPGDLYDPGIKLTSPALAGRFFTTEPPRIQIM